MSSAAEVAVQANAEFVEPIAAALEAERVAELERVRRVIHRFGSAGDDRAFAVLRDAPRLAGFEPEGWSSAFAGACREAADALLAEVLAGVEDNEGAAG